jgi:hypothetical protein
MNAEATSYFEDDFKVNFNKADVDALSRLARENGDAYKSAIDGFDARFKALLKAFGETPEKFEAAAQKWHRDHAGTDTLVRYLGNRIIREVAMQNNAYWSQRVQEAMLRAGFEYLVEGEGALKRSRHPITGQPFKVEKTELGFRIARQRVKVLFGRDLYFGPRSLED